MIQAVNWSGHDPNHSPALLIEERFLNVKDCSAGICVAAACPSVPQQLTLRLIIPASNMNPGCSWVDRTTWEGTNHQLGNSCKEYQYQFIIAS
jgi:hypothetical protein